MPVNLESQNLMISDFSVLHEIFHPASTASIDPKLVLSTGRAPAYLSPDRKGSSLSPAPVPLSVHELEARVEAKPDPGDLDPASQHAVTSLTSVSVSVSAVSPSSPGPAVAEGKASPVDIVHLAAEEIRKPLLKFRDESKVAEC